MPTSAIASTRCSSPTKRYGVIYADPPWSFKNFSEKGTGRNPVAHYQCMDFRQIAAIQPQLWAAKDCVLFLWATDPFLPKALELIQLLGFKYKTVGFYWAKTNKRANLECLSIGDFFTGLGYWSRANVEQCLLATRGKTSRHRARREHSRKPDEIYARIERLARGPYLEMSSRKSRRGWDAWGISQRCLMPDRCEREIAHRTWARRPP
jgi:N6-adenosine-specific RNA methylase IME4